MFNIYYSNLIYKIVIFIFSFLGVPLFIIVINDIYIYIDESANNQFILFIDDTAISVACIDNYDLNNKLANNVNKLKIAFDNKKLILNINKIKILNYNDDTAFGVQIKILQ